MRRKYIYFTVLVVPQFPYFNMILYLEIQLFKALFSWFNFKRIQIIPESFLKWSLSCPYTLQPSNQETITW